MKRIFGGLLAGIVLATAGVVVAQNVRDSDNLIMRALDPFIRSVGNMHIDNLAGTASAPLAHGAIVSLSANAVGESLSARDSGKTLIGTSPSLGQAYTLPTAANAGISYCFVAGHANGEILVNVQSGQTIKGKTHGADDGSGISTSAGVGVKNTAATNVIGDHTCIVSDGVTTWYMTSVAGVWASQ